MEQSNLIKDGEYIMYKGRPLVRKGTDLYYGDMSKQYHIFMIVMSECDKAGHSVPDQILVQLCDCNKLPKEQTMVKGFTEALDYAVAWLDHYNKE